MTQHFGEVTRGQQLMWATGDFHRIGVSHLVVGELLVRALHVHAGEAVLDVAARAGNTALAAARRWAQVTCTDYVAALLEHAAARARCEGLPLATQVADAQDLPFPEGSFDVVTTTFGAMFAPDQQRTATELIRVLKPGGRLGMANWTPEAGPAPSSPYRRDTGRRQPGWSPQRSGEPSTDCTSCSATGSSRWRPAGSTPTSPTTTPTSCSSFSKHRSAPSPPCGTPSWRWPGPSSPLPGSPWPSSSTSPTTAPARSPPPTSRSSRSKSDQHPARDTPRRSRDRGMITKVRISASTR